MGGDCAKVFVLILVYSALLSNCQRDSGFPLSWDSLRMVFRYKTPIPMGRTWAVSDMMMRFYSTTVKEPVTFHIRDSLKILSHPNFDLKKPTVLYAHGYLELWNDESLETVVKAYLEEGSHNIMVLDYANLVFGIYTSAVSHVVEIATEISKVLPDMLNEGMDVDKLHFVGHSMGAHILGLVARQLNSKGFRIKRMTALDPAYPLFYSGIFTIAPRLTAQDADFVDVIHTDGGGYGAPHSVGTVDFWPNEGVGKQPGCVGGAILFTTEDFCSHWRSWEFWAESVRGGHFLARKCKNYDDFLRETCSSKTISLMGLQANPGCKKWVAASGNEDLVYEPIEKLHALKRMWQAFSA